MGDELMFGYNKSYKISKENILYGHTSAVNALTCFEHSGINYLASGSDDKIIKIWNLSQIDNDPVILSSSVFVRSITAFEMNGKQFLACAGCYSNEIEIWNLTYTESPSSLSNILQLQ